MAMSVDDELHRIQILPDVLANQIAAGEVIERPASVIKELLENSIDAGATDIRVEVEAGGSELIRVRDNGHGIHRDDLVLALQSHATSKIRQQSDLQHITSLGFRGEALSSIASVSQFYLTSRQQGSDQAWQISKDPLAGSDALVPASHPVGSTVEVRNLFHATPARRKFLRSNRTEFLHILEMIRRIALSRFDITIRLYHNGKQVFYSRANDANRGTLIRTVMGKGFSQNARSIDCASVDMHLWGWLGTENLSRSQTDRQYFYFNGRMIRDKQVNHAIRMAYEDLLPTGRFPTYVIYMEADPAAADVNVHPTKYEIRFRNARDVHDFIFSSLKNSLSGESRLFDNREPGNVAVDYVPRGYTEPDRLREVPHYYSSLADTAAASVAAEVPGLGQPVAQLYGRFVITRKGNNWLLIDLHQARRHVIRSRMSAVTTEQPARQRPLLVPVIIDVTAAQAELVDRHTESIACYGLTMERYAPTAIIVRNIPALMPDVELQLLVRDVLAVFDNLQDQKQLPDKLIAVLVAHACDGYKSDLPVNTVQQLLRSLLDCGLDPDSGGQQGIWKTLDTAALTALLGDQ